MYTKGDFHVHTSASDGKKSPDQVVKEAVNNNLDIIAITDHDTTGGIKKAIDTSKDFNIRIIPGIELSTLHNGESIHILGFFKDDSYTKIEFQNFLKEIDDSRIKRAEQMIINLKKYFNIELDFQKILKDSRGIIARPHIANAILESGYDYSWNCIFDKLISKDSPAYVPTKKVTIPEGISLLKKYNAVTVLAHPALIRKTPVEDLMKLDFDGIEAIYPTNKKSTTKRFIKLAEKHNKFITAGSDYHGIGEVDTKHGNIGAVSLTGEHLETFLKNFSL